MKWINSLKRQILLCSAFILIAFMITTSNVWANIITTIDVKGSQRISNDTIKSYVKVKKGQNSDIQKENQSVKDLMKTGLFKNVSIDTQGSTLIISVQENPIINKIAFEGNKAIKDKDLLSNIPLKVRSIYSLSKVKDALQIISNYYVVSGMYNANITPKIIKLPYNRINLIFEVKENSRRLIQSIKFLGNKNYSSSTLKRVIHSKEYSWWKFLSNDDRYIPEYIKTDEALISKFYKNRGYAKVEVESANGEEDVDGKGGFAISFKIKEGSRYKVSQIDFTSSLSGLEVSDVQSRLLENIDKNDYYSVGRIENAINGVIDKANTLGFPFVTVQFAPAFDDKAKTVRLVFNVIEAPRRYIRRINISGNTRTMDEVVRYQMELAEGDPVNPLKLTRSNRNLGALDFFKSYDIKPVPTDKKDIVDLDVSVVEKRTGNITFGLGYSTLDGPMFEVGANERNVLGTGRSASINFKLQKSNTSANISFTDPRFRGRNWLVGLNFFITRNKKDRDKNDTYASTSIGGSLFTGYPLSYSLSQRWAFTIKNTKVYDIDYYVSPYIYEMAGNRLYSGISHTLTYDKRDRTIRTQQGYYISMTNEFAGIGGDVQLFRNEIKGAYFLPIRFTEDYAWVLENSVRIGNVHHWGDKNLIASDRYFLGGSDLHGFEYGTISPRDAVTNDNIGGETVYNDTLTLKVPLTSTDYPIIARAFADAGNTFGVHNVFTGNKVYQNKKPRVGIGVGVTWYSPFGQLGVDLGWAVVKDQRDQEKFITLNMGGQL